MSRPRLQVSLSDAEDRELYELRDDKTVPGRTKRRAEMLRLNHQGWKTEQIAEYVGCQRETVRQAIHRWQHSGLAGLRDAPRQGRPRQWQASDFAVVEQQLAGASTFNSRQIVELLKTECNVQLSRRQVSRLLKKRGTARKRTRQRHQRKQDPVARAQGLRELTALRNAAEQGLVRLLYMDETGFES